MLLVYITSNIYWDGFTLSETVAILCSVPVYTVDCTSADVRTDL